jgi:type II secretory ATPase GspE/PulE/Tfp pilus assembly ATPase PilB-like protein
MKNYEELLKKKIREENIFSQAALDEIVSESEKTNTPFLLQLFNYNSAEEEKILRVLASILSTRFVNLKKEDISKKVLEKIPAKFAWHYKFIPLQFDNGKLIIAVNIPLDTKAQDEIELITGLEVKIVLAKRKKIRELLKVCYGLGADTVEEMVSDKTKEMTTDSKIEDWNVEDIREKAGEASVVKLVNQIIAEAYNKRATDIHIEPYRGTIRLRYRIDGVLFNQYVPEKINRFLPAITSRIKIMSDLNIVERRIPQDGRALVRVKEQVLDLRVSIVPTPHGESVVIRILPTKMFFDLKSLGLSPHELTIFDNLLHKPNGIIFVTGPTGSGKTTTLYACLRKINNQKNKIISIEDPIEYEMQDVVQIQVNPSIGLTFAHGLRSMLRHDPDIMMVGEVRDKETAEIAVRVALTGHLVLSTLHTNDAPSSITRLIDIGIEPYLLASSVEAFIAQRLVRVICPQCKKAISDVDQKLIQHIKDSLGFATDSDLHFFKGSGCEKCNFTGFYGRTAVYEILLVDKNIRGLIKKRSSASEIRQSAIESGMKTLLQDCWQKVINGVTTVEEALRLSQDFLAEMEMVDMAAKKNKANNQKPIDSKELRKGNNSLNFADKRLHERVSKNIDIKLKLVDEPKEEILKIKNSKLKGDSKYSRWDGFFDDCLTVDSTDAIYQGVSVTAVNVSEGGVLFRSQYLLPVGSILDIQLTFSSISKSLECLAKVVRVEKDLPTCFYIAVCFMDIAGFERKIIKEVLAE